MVGKVWVEWVVVEVVGVGGEVNHRHHRRWWREFRAMCMVLGIYIFVGPTAPDARN